jgi:uncharacterized membrane protein YgcG
MTGFGRRFDPGELHDDGAPMSDAEAAGLLSTARDLEAFAASESIAPTVGFEDRVMAAIATEPPPRPFAAVGKLGFLGALRDAWRIAWSGDRPVAVRAQALALVLLVAVAVGAVGTVATVGALAFLQRDPVVEPDVPPVSPPPSALPSPSTLPSPTVTPTPSPTVTPSPSPSPSAEPSETPDASETPEGTDDSSGSGSGSDGGSGDDNSGPGGGGHDDSSGPGGPDDTPDPDDTPNP